MLSFSLSLRTTISARGRGRAEKRYIKTITSRFLLKSSLLIRKKTREKREKQNHHQVEDEFFHNKIERRIDV